MSDTRKIRLVMELRNAGIADAAVLSAIERVPREIFVPPTFRDQAYANTALPIGHGQTISEPLVVARMTQALKVDDRMKVLEVGTGSGYQAAVLARLCRRLYTVERHKPLLDEAVERFEALRLRNITAVAGDGSQGWPAQAPFQRILVACAAEDVPSVLADQLAPDGVMVLPIGDESHAQEMIRLSRSKRGFVQESLGPVRFVPLKPGAPEAERQRA